MRKTIWIPAGIASALVTIGLLQLTPIDHRTPGIDRATGGPDIGPVAAGSGTRAEAPSDLAARPWKTWRPGNAPRGDGPGRKPDDWFVRQRAYPYDDIPEPARRIAFEEAMTFQALHARGAQGGVWQAAGPINVGGRITDIAVPSGNRNTIYIGAADGGVFKSTDGGVSWTALFDDKPSLSIGALAIHPQNENILYVGTGEANAAGDTYAGDGVYRTLDGGQTWEHLGLRATAKIGRIRIDPTNPDRVFVAAMGRLFSTNPERGLYRSLDGGLTWGRPLFVNDSTGVVDVAIDPVNPSVVYAATWERIRRPEYRNVGGFGSGVHKSIDGGNTWTRLGPAQGLPAPAATIGRIGLALAESSPSTVYAFYCDHPGYFLGVYRTTNAGASWVRVNDGGISDVTSSFGWYFGQIRVAPSNPDHVYVLGVPMYRSTNGGGSWQGVLNGMHVDNHALWIDPADPAFLYCGNDGGFYRSTNMGGNWTKRNTLPITQFYAITVDEQLPWRLYGGTQDNSTPRTLTGGLDDWDVLYGGDGFYTLVDPTDSDIIYAEYQYGGLAKSTNGGGNFSSVLNGISGDDRRNWSTPVVMDPNDHLTLYYGTYRVYRTTNGAGLWSPISGDLTGGPGTGNLVFGTVTTIDASRTNPGTIIAGTDDGHVWVTTNSGASWTNVSAALPGRWVTRVTIDPTNSQIAYVTLSGYKIDESLPHIFRTANGGASWTDISSNLPPVPLNDVVVDPQAPSRLFVAADAGVYWTSSAGASWQPLGTGLPNSAVHDLHLHDGTRTLVAGTHGRSMFTFDLTGIVAVAGGAPAAADSPAIAVTPNPVREVATLSFMVDRAGSVTIEVFDLQGRLVRRLADARSVEAGLVRETWDGTDATGRPVANGRYFVRVETPAGARVGSLLVMR